MTQTKGLTNTLVKNNYLLSELFEDFQIPEINDFVFDNVQITLSDSSLHFSGDLKMDGILAPFQSYLETDKAITLTATIATGGDGVVGKLKPTNATFTSQVPFHKEVFTGVTLTKTFFELQISKNADSWQIVPKLTGDFDVDGLTDKEQGKLQVDVILKDKELYLNATCQRLIGAFGLQNLALENVVVNGELGTTNQLTLTALLDMGAIHYTFGGVITPSSVGVFATATDFSLQTLSSVFNEIAPTGLTLPDFGVTFQNTSIALATEAVIVEGKNLQKGLSLISTIKVHEYTIDVSAQIATTGVIFDGTLGNISVGPVALSNTDLNFEIYPKAQQKPSKFEITGTATIEGVSVNCGVYFEKDKTFTTVLYAILNAADFKFSQIFPETQGTFVNDLSFSKLGFVYASAPCSTQKTGFNFDVQKGLQLMGTLEEIPGLSELTGETHIGLTLTALLGTTTNITIAIPDTRLRLGSSVTCDPATLVIDLLPTPALKMIFGMDVSIPNQTQPLHFDMALALSAIQATGSVTMKNYWKNPFGIDGLKIGPALALQIGIIYEQFVATGIPSEFGMAGGLAIGDTIVDMAVNISEDPTHEILSGKLEELSAEDLVNFAASLVDLKIQEVPNFFELKELELYCAPTGGTIGTITYQQGFSFSGDIVIAGKEIAVYTRISDSGIQGAGHLDNIDLGPLKITGDTGKDAQVTLELTSSEQAFSIDGAFQFLGLEESIYADISNQGVSFQFSQNFFDTLSYEIQGKSSGSLSDPTHLSFELSGKMDNNITNFLKTQVATKIQDALNATEHTIDEAEAKVAEAQKAYEAEYNKAKETLDNAQQAANAELNKLTGNLNQAKQDYTKNVGAAQAEVEKAKKVYDNALDDAQNKVNQAQQTYDNGIDQATKALNQAQQTYNNGIKAAQDKVNDAQRAYDNAIGSAQRAVQNASKKVDALNHWYSYPAYLAAKGVLALAEKALDAVKYGADYTAFESAKLALHLAKTGANYTAFESAKLALQTAKTGANYTAFMSAKATLSAVKYGADYTAWQGALQALSAAKAVGQKAINDASTALNAIGKSAAYVALEAAKAGLTAVEKGTSAVAFDTAKAALQTAKAGAATVLKIADFIANHSGDIIDVKEITFQADFNAVQASGSLDATVDVVLVGNDYSWSIDLNIKQVTSFIEDVFNKAFDELKNLVS